MPLGTRHQLEGLLLDRRGGPELDVRGGGTWRLDAGWRARRLVGRRVKITGFREGFNLLVVKTVHAV